MKISRVQLKNVRTFENSEFTFCDTQDQQSIKVIVGENGTGKSTILKSIVYVFTLLNNEYGGQSFGIDDLYRDSSEHTVILDLLFNEKEMNELFLEKAKGILGDNKYYEFRIGIKFKKEERKYYYDLDTEFIMKKGLNTDLLKLFLSNFNSKEFTGSIILYFDPFRYYPNLKLEGPNSKHITESSKELSLSNSIVKVKQEDNEILELNNRYLHIKQWLINLDFKRLKNPTITNNKIFKQIISSFNVLYSPYRFEKISEEGKIFFGNNVHSIEIDHLSDGFKNIFILIGEILFRLYHSDRDNPEFFNNEAIILIDEIDCHLHPKWQINIMPYLKKMFPNCQFIVTTHSLFITNQLEKNEIIKLGEI